MSGGRRLNKRRRRNCSEILQDENYSTIEKESFEHAFNRHCLELCTSFVSPCTLSLVNPTNKRPVLKCGEYDLVVRGQAEG
jgi:hypothetical protein